MYFLSLSIVLLTSAITHAAAIQFQLSLIDTDSAGNRIERYTYFVNDLTLQRNEEVEIQFDPRVFSALSGPKSSGGFDLVLLQPNNPPGAPGELSLTPIKRDARVTNPFSVDFTLTGQGSVDSQPFFINQYDSSGSFVDTVSAGSTSPVNQATVPEPATFTYYGMALLFGVSRWAVRRQRVGAG